MPTPITLPARPSRPSAIYGDDEPVLADAFLAEHGGELQRLGDGLRGGGAAGVDEREVGAVPVCVLVQRGAELDDLQRTRGRISVAAGIRGK